MIQKLIQNLRRNKNGFTLIELIVVIAILGILIAILVPTIGGFISKANDAADNATAKSLNTAVTALIADGSIQVSGTGGTITTDVTSAGVATYAIPAASTGLTDATFSDDMKKLVGSTVFEKGGAKSGYVTTVAATSGTVTSITTKPNS